MVAMLAIACSWSTGSLKNSFLQAKFKDLFDWRNHLSSSSSYSSCAVRSASRWWHILRISPAVADYHSEVRPLTVILVSLGSNKIQEQHAQHAAYGDVGGRSGFGTASCQRADTCEL